MHRFYGHLNLLNGILLLTLLYSSCTPRRYPGQPVTLQVQPTPALLSRGKALVSMMCSDCHRDPVTGALSGKRLTDVPRMLGKVYSANITQHPQSGIGTYTEGQLAYLLRTGVDRHGRTLPMMQKPGLSDDDLRAVIAFLKHSDDPMVRSAAVASVRTRYSLPARLAMPFVAKPLPYPSGAVRVDTAQVAQGKYLVNVLGCYECHSGSVLKLNRTMPEKTKGYLAGGGKLATLEGESIRTPNLTMDAETGLGRWSRAAFVKALRESVRPDHSVVRYPMPTYAQLSEAEAGAIYAYLQAVPPVRHAVKRPAAAPAPKAQPGDTLAAGSLLYALYGCQSCHGATGLGIADLRMASRKYPDDASLKARIQNPAAFLPDSRMPKFEGVVAEQDYAPLLAYVRWLGKKGAE
jgi:mono/diheme cytochrome c family protein